MNIPDLNTQRFVPPTSTGMWTIEHGDVEAGGIVEVIPEKGQVYRKIASKVGSAFDGRICVDEDVGQRSWLVRYIFCMNPRILQMHFALEWCGETCSLIFFDEAASGYCAVDPRSTFQPDEDTRRHLRCHGFLDQN